MTVLSRYLAAASQPTAMDREPIFDEFAARRHRTAWLVRADGPAWMSSQTPTYYMRSARWHGCWKTTMSPTRPARPQPSPSPTNRTGTDRPTLRPA